MRVSRSLFLGSLASVAHAQSSTFEPADFNVTEALLDNGVNVSAIPALAGLVERSSLSACSITCASLRLIFGSSKVVSQGTSAYDSFTGSYWSVQQEQVDPYCIFKPSSAVDVSSLLLLSRLTQCPFAVKSGGHAAFAGASSIQGGITVALQNLNEVTLASDKKTVAVGPGNTWYNVYTNLQSQNLAVIGGRVAAIGVGGLTLGGGISFFSNIYGWACDNVATYEVVTASGIVVNASPTSFSDLYWALRGGGNNFGIVTKFTLNTIKQGLMWGGGLAYLETEFPALIQAFYNLGKNSAQDKNAAQILSFAYAQGTKIAAADLQYALPNSHPAILNEYLSIPGAISNTTSIRTLASLTLEFNASNPNGLRETYWAAAFKLDQNFTSFIKDVFYEEVATVADAASLTPAVTLQVITVPEIQAMAKNGGNALGLDADCGPLILMNPNMMWANAADDNRILAANSNLVKRTVAEAQARGLYNEYIYMNYASQFQAVVPSYGSANHAKLKSIATKYDPTGVFQTLQPGYFKLDGAPNSTAI